MSPEQIALILGALGMGGVLVKIVEVLSQGWRDSKEAREISSNQESSCRLEVAFWSEKVQETRELYLVEGGDPDKLGPPPRYSARKDGYDG